MAPAEITVLVAALLTTTLAVVLPWIQREPGFPWSGSRRAVLAGLIVDAAFHWWALAQLPDAAFGPGWTFTFLIVAASNLGLGFFVAARAVDLPPLVRWGSASALLILEPVLLLLSFLAVAVRASFV